MSHLDLINRISRGEGLKRMGWSEVVLPTPDAKGLVSTSAILAFYGQKDEMMQWCEENAPDAYFYVTTARWIFKDPKKAIMFKLAWGGMNV